MSTRPAPPTRPAKAWTPLLCVKPRCAYTLDVFVCGGVTRALRGTGPPGRAHLRQGSDSLPKRNDYYKTLGLKQGASADDIKRAYRKLAKQYHPDRNPDNPSAEGKFKEVQWAYQVLSDPKKRADYDEFGEVGVGSWETDPHGRRVYQWGNRSSVNLDDLEDLFSAFGTGGGQRASVFDQFLGGFRRGQPPAPTRRRGADETRSINLTFDQVVHGAVVTVHLSSPKEGRSETLDVRIPPGVDRGQRIRIAGKGHAGSHGGPPGDLYLECAIKPHPYFTRDGADLYIDVPVTPPEVALGAKIDVPSLDGFITVTLPAGAPSGTKLRLAGRGLTIQGGQGCGDLYVGIVIVPPKELADEERRLYTQLRERDRSDPRGRCPWSESPTP